MSTKNSLFYSDELHLFKECLDDDSVYLKINKNNLKMELCLPLEKFLQIVKTIDLDSLETQSKITDDEIKKYCQIRVQQRSGSDGIIALSGFLIFGDAKSPEEQQVENGFRHFSSMRDRLKKLVDIIKKTYTSSFSFGLEDVIKHVN